MLLRPQPFRPRLTPFSYFPNRDGSRQNDTNPGFYFGVEGCWDSGATRASFLFKSIFRICFILRILHLVMAVDHHSVGGFAQLDERNQQIYARAYNV